MLELDQKIIEMTYEEFKKWNVPEGYRVTHMTGEEKLVWPGSIDRYFNIHVVLQKEKE
jgi:hypothetical protein